VVIRLIPPKPTTGKDTPGTPPPLWKLNITAAAGLASDRANYIGVRADASDAWDAFDHAEPPVIGEYVSVAFPHTEWTRYPSDYTVDFRPPSGTLSWDFEVRTNIEHERVTVSLDGAELLPGGAAYEIIDRETGRKVESAGNSFSFDSGNGGVRRFALTVRSAADPGRDTLPDKPGMFVTARAYPNPFNPQTILRYELPQPGTVTVTVFNSVGQMVRRFDLGRKEEGAHELVFEADGLTSGTYMYRVDAGYSSVIGKVLYMK
ncbi:MAG: T9SS type A sorting domain-containing protein, partial [Candidatus Latescibacterota bacterium]